MEETSQAEPVVSDEESSRLQQLCDASESDAPANGDCPVPAKSKRVNAGGSMDQTTTTKENRWGRRS